MQPNTHRTQPVFRTAYPASHAVLAVAADAALNAQQIVADFRASHDVDDCDMPALRAVQRKRPMAPWTEEQAIACDLAVNAMKNSGEYDRIRAGGRFGVWA